MVYNRTLTLATKGFCDLNDITGKVEQAVKKSKIKNGLVNVFITGSTAGLTTIEYESGLIKDFCELIERIIPQDIEYEHNKKWGDGNGFSHVRSSLLKTSLTVPLIEGELKLGIWQQIVLVDFDNRSRNREVVVQVLGD